MSNAISLRPPKYRHHKGKGLAVVTINGRDIYLGKFNSAGSKQAYKRLAAEWMVSGGKPTKQARDTTVVEVLAAFMRFAKSYYRKNGKLTNEVVTIKRALNVVRGLYGRELAADFGPLALKAVRQSMIELGWCRNQVNKQIDRVRRAFKWAVSEEIIPSSVYESLRTVTGLRRGRTLAKENSPVKPVEQAIVDATIERLPAVVADLVRVQRLTGARPGEVCEMRPMDINRDGDVWEYVPQSHKTEHHGQQRVVFIGPQAQEVLVKYLLRPAETYCFSPADSEAKRRAERHLQRKTPLSCGNKPGSNCRRNPKRVPREKYDTTSLGRAITRAATKAGVEAWTPHRLRHSFATQVRKTHGLEAVQVVLGHSKASTTEIYAERNFGLAARVAKEVG